MGNAEEVKMTKKKSSTKKRKTNRKRSKSTKSVRKNRKNMKKNRKSIGKVILGVVLTIGILSAAYGMACKTIGEDQVIWENTSINGVHLTDQTIQEAEAAVQEQFRQTYENKVLKIVLEGQEYALPIFSMLDLNVEKEIGEAYELGHGHWLSRGVDWVRKEMGKEKTKEVTVEPVVAHPELLDGLIEATGIQSYNSTKESSYEINENTLVIHKGKTGQSADIEKLKENILQVLEEKSYDAVIECPYTEHGYADLVIQDIAGQVHQEVVEAVLDKSKNEVVPSQDGISLDVEKAVEIYNNTAEGADAVIELTITKPQMTTEDLKANLFTTTLGGYSTYGAGNANRRNNISLAVKAINDLVLLPGETFSYNETLGQRTKAKGYKEAGAYSDGSVVQEVGGGICQVSSTLFAAVLETNLEIVQRRNHSMTVSYMPMGMDATVSWGGPDLKIKNNRRYPIKFAAGLSGDEIKVKVIGANETDTSIKVTTEQTGALSADTYRNTYDSSGKLISKEKVCTSKYKPKSTPTPVPTQEPAVSEQPPAQDPSQAPPQDPSAPIPSPETPENGGVVVQ